MNCEHCNNFVKPGRVVCLHRRAIVLEKLSTKNAALNAAIDESLRRQYDPRHTQPLFGESEEKK